jgi:hypothetical protein
MAVYLDGKFPFQPSSATLNGLVDQLLAIKKQLELTATEIDHEGSWPMFEEPEDEIRDRIRRRAGVRAQIDLINDLLAPILAEGRRTKEAEDKRQCDRMMAL